MSNGWAERFIPVQHDRNLQYEGEILCLGIVWGDTIRILDRVEKGDRLNGVRVESCKEDGNDRSP